MPKKLSDDQVRRYEEQGFLAPIPVLSRDEVADCRRQLDEAFSALGTDEQQVKKTLQFKIHLLFPWLDRLIRHPSILDAVEDIIGPDILVWNSGFLIKKPRDPSFVSWHQDATYWGLEPGIVVTGWLAFSDSVPASGCVRVIPGSHKWEQIPHTDTYGKDNMLSRGQEIAVKVDESQAADMSLRAGEMSLHHVKVVHGSQPNRSDQPRIGFIINFIPTRVRQLGWRDSAMLVRGEDTYGNFDPEPRPLSALDNAARKAHADAMQRQLNNIYDGAKTEG